VIAANLAPDHVTINRFRSEYQDALAELFGQVLRLCARAGMVKVGVIAVDGTRVAANASIDANGDYEQIARKILEEAAEIDAAEDELHGDKRGDELPAQLTTRHGRQAWLREAKRQLEAERAADPKPVPRARAPRLKEAKRRLEEELWTEQRANAAYEAWRATARDTLGRGLGRRQRCIRRHSGRLGRSTSPILTRGWCRAAAGSCRGTPRRPSPQQIRS
jgi:hypothetical protein